MNNPFQNADRFELRDDLVVEEIDDEIVVLDLAGNKYFGLNGVAWLIWKAIDDGDADLETIAYEIAEEFDIEAERARADAEAFIGQLLDAGLATRRKDLE